MPLVIHHEGASNEEIIQGVASVLREASAALARLGVPGGALPGAAAAVGAHAGVEAEPPPPLRPPAAAAPAGGQEGNGLASAATALAHAAAAIKGGVGGALAAVPTSDEQIDGFVADHGLEPWVGEALNMLSPMQRETILSKPLRTENARNPNGIVVSRIKQVAAVGQRVHMFVKINDLGDGVVDRLSTLTEEQCEAVMDSGLKIQRATNPSGVAMNRITEALRHYPGKTRPIRLISRSDASQFKPLGGLRDHASESRGSSKGVGKANDCWGQHPRDRSRSRSLRSSAVGSGRWPQQAAGRAGTLVAKDARQQNIFNQSEPGHNWPADVKAVVGDLCLEAWCGEVLKRLSLWQRQTVIKELGNMRGVKSTSGVVMSRVRNAVSVDELTAIFVDLNGLDRETEAKLMSLTTDQRSTVMAPGIYVQNVRNPSTAVRGRIKHVLEGKDAMGRPLRTPQGEEVDYRTTKRDTKARSVRHLDDDRASSRDARRSFGRHGDDAQRSSRHKDDEDDDDDDDSHDGDDKSSTPPRRRRRRRR